MPRKGKRKKKEKKRVPLGKYLLWILLAFVVYFAYFTFCLYT